MFCTTPLQPITATWLITDVEILDTEAETSTALIRTCRRQLNGLKRTFQPLDLDHSDVSADIEPTAATRLVIVFTCIIINVNRRCTILPFLFNKQPTRDDMPSHSTSSPHDANQHVPIQPPLHCKTPAPLLIESALQTFTDKVQFNTKKARLDKRLKHAPLLTCKVPLWTGVSLKRPQHCRSQNIRRAEK